MDERFIFYRFQNSFLESYILVKQALPFLFELPETF
jgi:hypothetical protein